MNYENMLNETANNTNSNGLRAGARFVIWNQEEGSFQLHSFGADPSRQEMNEFLDDGGLIIAGFPGTMVTATTGQNGQRLSLVPKGTIRAQRDETGKAIADGQDWAIGGWLMVGKVGFGRFSGYKVVFGAIGTDISSYEGYKPAANSMARIEEFGPHQEAISLALFDILGANDGVSEVRCEVDDHQVVVQNLTRTLPQLFQGFGIDRTVTEGGPKRQVGVTNRGAKVATGVEALNKSQSRYGNRWGNQTRGAQTDEVTRAVSEALKAR